MATPEKKLEKKKTKKLSKLNLEDKKSLAFWVGERILESQEKMGKTLDELSVICKKATEEK